MTTLYKCSRLWKSLSVGFGKVYTKFLKEEGIKLKGCYIDIEHRAIADVSRIDLADLDDFYANSGTFSYMINRINVPFKFRGNGYGSALLNQILADADKEGEELYLFINPYGEMTYEQLEKWYKRHGFTYWKGGCYRRKNGNRKIHNLIRAPIQKNL